jgi:hypothetical protein
MHVMIFSWKKFDNPATDKIRNKKVRQMIGVLAMYTRSAQAAACDDAR